MLHLFRVLSKSATIFDGPYKCKNNTEKHNSVTNGSFMMMISGGSKAFDVKMNRLG